MRIFKIEQGLLNYCEIDRIEWPLYAALGWFETIEFAWSFYLHQLAINAPIELIH